ncbi:DUF192 domain-containing protein [Roseibium marinum]|uniref:DUF192 domain-containing protein n=1 Tax=Roseibium marinum TaxID=281252 RepID=A0A2S3UNX4_9HYPH|nr:DUF192 domain-containing protein [Roseibium marinum]POF29280.1 hypothetical protein CLV41_10951 [Roseibium marinum]
MISRLLRLAAFGFTLGVSFFTASLATNAGDDQTQLRTESLVVRSGDREHRFEVEVAENDRERARGLMFRQEMAAGHGMLFIFEGEGDRYFWMKNTPLPLDIIYISAAGRIVSIAADTTPFSEAAIPSGKPARYVLELNAGTSARLEINTGDVVSSPSMAAE